MRDSTLTPQERVIVKLVANGLTNAQIADNLRVSVSTVKVHLSDVMRKWDCANRTQVAVESVRRGL